MKVKLIVCLSGGMDRVRVDVARPIGAAPTVSVAFRQGFLDGLATPDELTSGFTYGDRALDDAYSEGANLGQAVGRLYGAVGGPGGG